MDALLSTFLAIALAEQGDRLQLLVAECAARFGARAAVAAGLIAGCAASHLIAAAGGVLVHEIVPFRALTLLVALALASTGAAALVRAKRSAVIAYPQLKAFGGPAFAAFVLQFGGGAQFITFALAARADSAVLATIGATLGSAAAVLPALGWGDRPPAALRPVRIGIGILFLVAGAIVALAALRLI